MLTKNQFDSVRHCRRLPLRIRAEWCGQHVVYADERLRRVERYRDEARAEPSGDEYRALDAVRFKCSKPSVGYFSVRNIAVFCEKCAHHRFSAGRSGRCGHRRGLARARLSR